MHIMLLGEFRLRTQTCAMYIYVIVRVPFKNADLSNEKYVIGGVPFKNADFSNAYLCYWESYF